MQAPWEGRSARDREARVPKCHPRVRKWAAGAWATGCHLVGKLSQCLFRASCQPQRWGGCCSSEAAWTQSSTQRQRTLGLGRSQGPSSRAGVSGDDKSRRLAHRGQPERAGSPLRRLAWSVGCATAPHNSEAVSCSLQSVWIVSTSPQPSPLLCHAVYSLAGFRQYSGPWNLHRRSHLQT